MNMTTTKKVVQQIDQLPAGMLFDYGALELLPDEYLPAAKALERLKKAGKIQRWAKGIYYKPVDSIFGPLQPTNQAILDHYLFEAGKRIAYVTGPALYHQLGLTTQIPAALRIASYDRRIAINAPALKAKPASSYAPVTDANYELLGLLDTIKDFNRIPDGAPELFVRVMREQLTWLSAAQRAALVGYARLYPPRARALLAALLEASGFSAPQGLRESLNPLTKFSLGLPAPILPTAPRWQIT
jgi:hypothetical protein